MARAACASKGMYMLCTLDEFWRAHVLESFPNHFQYQGGWKKTYVAHKYPNFKPAAPNAKKGKRKAGPKPLLDKDKEGFFSDLFYQPHHCATAPLLPEWLETDNIDRVHNISFEEVRAGWET